MSFKAHFLSFSSSSFSLNPCGLTAPLCISIPHLTPSATPCATLYSDERLCNAFLTRFTSPHEGSVWTSSRGRGFLSHSFYSPIILSTTMKRAGHLTHILKDEYAAHPGWLLSQSFAGSSVSKRTTTPIRFFGIPACEGGNTA